MALSGTNQRLHEKRGSSTIKNVVKCIFKAHTRFNKNTSSPKSLMELMVMKPNRCRSKLHYLGACWKVVQAMDEAEEETKSKGTAVTFRDL